MIYKKTSETSMDLPSMDQLLENSKKTYFWSILGSNWSKLALQIFFRKIGLLYIWGTIVTHLCTKNQKKLMNQSRENSKKPYFWSILGPNWAKVAPQFFSNKNQILLNLNCYSYAALYKKSEKTNEPISRKFQKTLFLVHFGPKLGQMGPKKFFIENQTLLHLR